MIRFWGLSILVGKNPNYAQLHRSAGTYWPAALWWVFPQLLMVSSDPCANQRFAKGPNGPFRRSPKFSLCTSILSCITQWILAILASLTPISGVLPVQQPGTCSRQYRDNPKAHFLLSFSGSTVLHCLWPRVWKPLFIYFVQFSVVYRRKIIWSLVFYHGQKWKFLILNVE